MNGLERGVVVVVVGEPEPDVIRSKEVGVLRQGRFVRIVSIQLFRQNHVSKFEFAIDVCQNVPMMRKLGKTNIIFSNVITVESS